MSLLSSFVVLGVKISFVLMPEWLDHNVFASKLFVSRTNETESIVQVLVYHTGRILMPTLTIRNFLTSTYE